MLSLTLFSLATLALTSLSAAAPAVVEATDGEFTSIDFDGRTLHYYTDAFEFDADPPAASLSKRDATCGASDFESAPPPYASVSDCQALATGIYRLSGRFIVQHPGPASQTKIAYLGTCAFGASTESSIETYIGTADIGDLVTSSISALQSGGVVCAQGNMLCENNGPMIVGQSAVFWALYHQ